MKIALAQQFRTLLWAAAAVLLAHAAAATERNAGGRDPSEQDFLGELPVVLSASRLAQPLADAPGAVTVIDRDMIKASGAREIADLFRLVPGFQVSYANGANPVVTYHGLTGQYSQRMQVLIDGRSLYSSFYFGGVNWNMLPISLDDIERIEVLRGTNSAAYGANAFLGVANIITRHASQSRGTLASYTGGNQAIEDTLLRHGGRVGALDYRFAVGRRGDSGFDVGPHNNVVQRIYDDKRVSFFNFRGDYRLTNRDELSLQLGANENSAGAGFPTDAGNPVRTQRANNYFGQLQWRRALSTDHELSLTGYYQQEGGSESYFVGPFLFDWGRVTERSNVEFQHIFRPHRDLRVVWGVESRYDQMRSQLLFNSPDWRSTSLGRLFANGEWRASSWLLVNAGGMLEYYNLTGTDFAPRLMFNFQPSPHHTFRVGTTGGYRTPALAEQKGDVRVAGIPFFRGGGDLVPEHVRSQELGYFGEIPELRVTADLRIYREYVSNMITNMDAGGIRVFVNGYNARMRGAEYQLRWRPAADTLVMLNQAFQYIDGIEKLKSSDTTARELEMSAPTRTTALFLSTRLAQAWNLSLTKYWVGAMVWPYEGDPQRKYQRLDLRLAYRFAPGPTRGEFAVVTQNLGNPYTEFRPEYNFNRRTFATVSLEF